MLQQRKRSSDIRQHEIQAELMRLPIISVQLHDVESRYRYRYYDTLSRFQSVYASQYINSIRTKHRQHPHINVIQHSHIHRKSEPMSERFRNDYRSRIEIYVINHQQRKRRNRW